MRILITPSRASEGHADMPERSTAAGILDLSESIAIVDAGAGHGLALL